MYHILAIGDPIIDTHVRIDDSSAECQVIPHGTNKLCFDYGSKIPILNSFQSLGGNAANVGIGTAKLGLKSSLISTVGNDASGQMAVRELAKYGVDTRYLTIDAQARTRYSIVLNYLEERTILSFSDKKNYVWPEPAPETEWVYYTGLSEGFEKLHTPLLKYLKNHPTVHLAFNPGSYLMKYGRDYVKETVQRADLLIVNLEEAEMILGTTFEKEKNIKGIINKLLTLGSKEVALTDGQNGAYAGDKDEMWRMKSLPIPVIAKTGAGDSFSAGYIAARYYGHDIKHALAWGVANSSGVIQKEGPHSGLLDQKGIEAMLKQFPHVSQLPL
jgi:sugar/nucleoside kinase (ribokinase family)